MGKGDIAGEHPFGLRATPSLLRIHPWLLVKHIDVEPGEHPAHSAVARSIYILGQV